MTLSIFEAARQAPDRIALVAEGTRHRTTDLAARSKRALDWLACHGVTSSHDPTVPVGLTAEMTVDAVAMAYALMSLGVPFLPLHPELGSLERSRALASCGCSLVVDPEWARLTPGRSDVAEPSPIPDDERWLAVVFTSGSSGTPKGVALSRRAFRASADASADNLGWQADDRWLLGLPYSHIGGLSILTRCLYARRPIVMAPAHADRQTLFGIVEQYRVSLASLVPAQLARWLEVTPSWCPPKSLRAVLVGGAPCRRELLEEARARHVPVLRTYGLTEACSQICTQRYGATPPGLYDCGPPLRGIEVACPENLVHVRGPTLLSTYLPRASAQAQHTDQWHFTGDRGWFDELGHLRVLGRADDVIITGGQNVSAHTVEEAVLSCPGVKAVCVVPIPDPVWGQIIAAMVVLDAAPSTTLEQVERQAERRLGRLNRPRRWAVVDALPLTTSGKVDRRATADRIARNGASSPHFTKSF